MRGPDRNRNLSLSKGTLGVDGLAELLFDATGGGAGATVGKGRSVWEWGKLTQLILIQNT